MSGSTMLNSLATTVATPRKNTGLLLPHSPFSSCSTRIHVSCPSPPASSRQETAPPDEAAARRALPRT
uniref:PANC n=1 Tax=Arundo donax TaxID=35708 RepID=A0A0A8XQ14_ARUDO